MQSMYSFHKEDWVKNKGDWLEFSGCIRPQGHLK